MAEDNNNNHQEEGNVEGGEGEPQRTYEITATDHINKNMLETFKSHLENKTVKVPENDEKDTGDWDDS